MIEGTDAVYQEVQELQTAFDGARTSISPLIGFLPKPFYGFHQFKIIRRQDSVSKFNHIFAPTLFYFPIFNYLKKPIVYTVVASIQQQKKPPNIKKLNGLHRIVVSNQRDRLVLESWGIKNYSLIHPGIDTSGFSPHPLALDREMTLLLASAPWDKSQFYSKGVDLLLEAAANLPWLKLTLLWRGLLFEELTKRIDYYGVTQKVEVINRKVNVDDLLRRVHATVLLTNRADGIVAYPHSLIESLAAGKPVVVSRLIPIADYVTKNGCGVVVEDLRLDSLYQSIELLRNQYQSLVNNANIDVAQHFSVERMIDQYSRVYYLQ